MIRRFSVLSVLLATSFLPAPSLAACDRAWRRAERDALRTERQIERSVMRAEKQAEKAAIKAERAAVRKFRDRNR